MGNMISVHFQGKVKTSHLSQEYATELAALKCQLSRNKHVEFPLIAYLFSVECVRFLTTALGPFCPQKLIGTLNFFLFFSRISYQLLLKVLDFYMKGILTSSSSEIIFACSF